MLMDILAVFVAAISGFVIGGLWYGPLFGKKWMAEHNFTEDDLKMGNPAKIYGGAFAFSLLSAIAFSLFLHAMNATIARPVGESIDATQIGSQADLQLIWNLPFALLIVGGFILPAFAVNYLFSRASLTLFLIDAGYWLWFYLAMAIVFGLFG